MNSLSETFAINNRINLFLLKAISENYLSDKANGKGRTVAEQFEHMYDIRFMWVKSARPDLIKNITKIDKEKAITHSQLLHNLEESSNMIENLLATETEKIKGFKPNPTAFVAYLSAHEAHHRGQIILTLKLNNHVIDKKIQFGLWEWGVR